MPAPVHQGISDSLRACPRCSPVGRCPRATPALCRERRVLEVAHTVLSHGSQSQPGWCLEGRALSQCDLLHDNRSHLRASELHRLVVPLLGWASDPVATAESGAVPLAGRAGAGVAATVGRGRGRGRRHTPRRTSRLVARRGRSRRQPVPTHAWRGDPRRSARDARPQLTRRVTPPRLRPCLTAACRRAATTGSADERMSHSWRYRSIRPRAEQVCEPTTQRHVTDAYRCRTWAYSPRGPRPWSVRDDVADLP
jgi:hypothetical protein